MVSASLFFNDTVTYDINAAGTADAVKTVRQYLSDSGGGDYLGVKKARQPTKNGSARIIDALDDRISANAWEVKGKIYFVHTVRALGTDHDVVRIVVLDKATGNVLSETDITDPSGNFDFYQGSLAVNSSGQLVVGFNRSGSFVTGLDGRISIFARAFITNPDGTLTQTAPDVLIKQSLVDDYHNGSAINQNPVGRQRWGDYSSVTLDPTNKQSFWVTGQFARNFAIPGSGFGRWGTWVAQVNIAGVPEPQSWALMIIGFGIVGGSMRRQRTLAAVTA
ncbi:MAG: PEPxxWA-CTERM sorting domain-containing protein [Polymorphobacter sp.]